MAGTNTPGGGSTGYTIDGITTVIFGTDGYLQSPAPGGSYAGTGYYIVDSIDPSVKVDQVYGENGTGVESWRANIVHGARWEIVVQDDTAQGAFTINGTVTLADGGLMVPGNTNRSTTYSATVIAISERFQRKQAAMRTLTVERLTLIEGGA